MIAMTRLTVLYGTETGNSELLAMDICKNGTNAGLDCVNFGMEQIENTDFIEIENLLIVCSTWGDGEQPDNALDLFEYVEDLGDSELNGMKYSVLALGDTAFDLFCEAGKEWDRVLEEKGANRVYPRVDCDVDYEDDAEEWIENVIAIFS